MFIVIYTVVWLACSFVLSLFSFLLGRCSRRLPVIDDGIPWVMHRSVIAYGTDKDETGTGLEQVRHPRQIHEHQEPGASRQHHSLMGITSARAHDALVHRSSAGQQPRALSAFRLTQRHKHA